MEPNEAGCGVENGQIIRHCAWFCG